MHLIDFIRDAVGLLAGGMIGLAFGTLQQLALRRHERLEREGKLKNGWSLMPGSGARIAYFVIALVLVQLVCPALFVDTTQWWVSGGVVLGHGWLLWLQLRRRKAQLA
jgi:hypothetical protein